MNSSTYLKNAYKIGFMAEFEYPIAPTRTKTVISNLLWQTSGGEFISAIWLTCGNSRANKREKQANETEKGED